MPLPTPEVCQPERSQDPEEAFPRNHCIRRFYPASGDSPSSQQRSLLLDARGRRPSVSRSRRQRACNIRRPHPLREREGDDGRVPRFAHTAQLCALGTGGAPRHLADARAGDSEAMKGDSGWPSLAHRRGKLKTLSKALEVSGRLNPPESPSGVVLRNSEAKKGNSEAS